MHKILAAAVLLALSATAAAQTVDNTVNTNSTSGAVANSSSESAAGASSDNLNVVNPNQSVGVGFTQTFEASNIPRTTTQKVKTNAAVPLAAAVSFSSDYCGGTVSAGASGFGLSIGASGPKMDGNCQALRRAEKFGTAAANAYNAGLTDWAGKLIAMQVWEICMAGNDAVESRTAEACEGLALLGGDRLPGTPQAAVMQYQEPSPPQPAPAPQQYQPRQPRGEVAEPVDNTVAAAHRARITGSNGTSAELEEAKKIGR